MALGLQSLFQAFQIEANESTKAIHGNLDDGLRLFDFAIDSYHQAGSVSSLWGVFPVLVVLFDRTGRPDVAAVLHGAEERLNSTASWPAELPLVVDHVRTVLGGVQFNRCVATGAAMGLAEAVRYSRAQIQLLRSELEDSS